jgi:predicted dehydrogenase
MPISWGRRMFFGAEPTEAFAVAASLPEKRFAEIDEMLTVTLRIPGARLAQFVVSYGTNLVNECRIVGTKGDLRLSPAFAYDKPIEQWMDQTVRLPAVKPGKLVRAAPPEG